MNIELLMKSIQRQGHMVIYFSHNLFYKVNKPQMSALHWLTIVAFVYPCQQISAKYMQLQICTDIALILNYVQAKC